MVSASLSPVIDFLDDGLARYRGTLGNWVPDGPALRRYP